MNNSQLLQDSQQYKTLTVYARLHNGNGCCLNVRSNISAEQLVDIIKNSQLQLPEEFKLIFKGKVIINYHLTLQELDIGDHSIIHVQSSQIGEVNQLKIDIGIYFKQERISIRMKRIETIQQLKTKIYRLLHIPPKKQHLIFRGLQLQKQLTLDDYQIKNGSLLCLGYDEQLVKSDQNKINEYNGLQLNEQLHQSVISLDNDRHLTKLNIFRSQTMIKYDSEEQPVFQVNIRRVDSIVSDLFSEKQFQYQILGGKQLRFGEITTKDELKSTKQQSQFSQHVYDQGKKNQAWDKLQVDSDVSYSQRLMII